MHSFDRSRMTPDTIAAGIAFTQANPLLLLQCGDVPV
jgi:hypothetical protein